MVGYGIFVFVGKNFFYFCEEYGYIYGILFVCFKIVYYQGILCDLFKIVDCIQYYWLDFVFFGEQVVQNKEFYVDFINFVYNFGIFGYILCYIEYCYNSGCVYGQMKIILNIWQMVCIFVIFFVFNFIFI